MANGSARVSVPVVSVPTVPAAAPRGVAPEQRVEREHRRLRSVGPSSPTWASTHGPGLGSAAPTAAVMRSESPSSVASVRLPPSTARRRCWSRPPPVASPSFASNEARVRAPVGSPNTTDTRYAPAGNATGAANPTVTARLDSLPMPSPSPTATDCTASAGSMVAAAATRSAPTKAMISRGNGVTGGVVCAPASTIEPASPSSSPSSERRRRR